MPQGRIAAAQARYAAAQKGKAYRRTSFNAEMIARAKRAAYERILELLTAERDMLDAKAKAKWLAAQAAAEAEAAAEEARVKAKQEAEAAKAAAEAAEAEEKARLEVARKAAEQAHAASERAARKAVREAAEAKADAEAAAEEAAEAEAKLQEARAKFQEELKQQPAPEPIAEEPVAHAVAAVEKTATEVMAEPPAEGVPAEEPAPVEESSETKESAEAKRSTERVGVTETSTAEEICAAYFKAMDVDDSGFIEETEMLQISEIAFEESAMNSMDRWNQMLKDMDKDHDGKVSCEEYTNFWMEDTKPKQQADGTFVPGYAEYLIERLEKLTELKKELNAKTPATELCETFFDALDLDSSGEITKEEILTCAAVAFGETEAAGEERWAKMVADMDKDHDGKISREEYTSWWMTETKSKQAEDGTFVEGYGEFLVAMLEKLRNLKAHEEELYAHQVVDEDVHTLYVQEWTGELPGGSWQATSRNVEVEDGLLTAELQKIDGSWAEATADFIDGDEFSNDDGKFKKTKSGKPPPMSYIETPDPDKVAEVKKELTEEEVTLLHHLSYGGWLKKRGGTWKSWKTRWFAIQDGTITYGVHRDETPIAKIVAAKCRIKPYTGRHKDDDEGAKRFVLVMPGRELVLSAFTVEDKEMWIRGIQLVAAGGSVGASDEHLVREGWMWKRGGHTAGMHKRYFRLVNSQQHGARLYWFMDAYHVTHPKGELPLGGASVKVDPGNRTMTITTDIGTERTFRCPGLGALNDWSGDVMKYAEEQKEAFTEEDLSALTAEFEHTMLGVLGFKPDKKWMANQEKKRISAAKGDELAAFGI